MENDALPGDAGSLGSPRFRARETTQRGTVAAIVKKRVSKFELLRREDSHAAVHALRLA